MDQKLPLSLCKVVLLFYFHIKMVFPIHSFLSGAGFSYLQGTPWLSVQWTVQEGKKQEVVHAKNGEISETIALVGS